MTLLSARKLACSPKRLRRLNSHGIAQSRFVFPRFAGGRSQPPGNYSAGASDIGRSGNVDLLPVLIRSVYFSKLRTVGIAIDRLARSLNSIDRWRQRRHFWSFVSHGFHLLSVVVSAFQLLAS